MTTQAIDREGVFKARPRQWSVTNPPGKKSVGIRILFGIDSQYDPASGSWGDWTQYGDWTVEGTFWVIGKNGQILADKVAQLAELLGWDQQLTSIVQTNPPSELVQVTVRADSYKGETRFRADWLAAVDADPTGGGGGVTVEQAKQRMAERGIEVRL